jgi:hypothetical protein
MKKIILFALIILLFVYVMTCSDSMETESHRENFDSIDPTNPSTGLGHPGNDVKSLLNNEVINASASHTPVGFLDTNSKPRDPHPIIRPDDITNKITRPKAGINAEPKMARTIDMPARDTKDMPNDMPKDMYNHMPKDMPKDMYNHMTKDMPKDMPKDMYNHMPKDMPKDMYNHMPKDMPKDMYNHMPKDMYNHMTNDKSDADSITKYYATPYSEPDSEPDSGDESCDTVKCSSGSCGSGSESLHPVMDPRFNMREVAKQALLLEDHLNNTNKRCFDCIRKHFLITDGLLEEAVSLEKNVGDRAKYRSLYLRWVSLEKQYSMDPKNSDNLDEISKQIRVFRKPLVEKYFDLVKEYEL